MQRQCYKLYGQANMLARKFYMCTVDVKIALFKAYCTSFYTSHLWCSYSKAKMKKLQVAFNDALRILLKFPRWMSASQLFVSIDVPTLHAVLRNYMYSFLCRLRASALVGLTVRSGAGNGDRRIPVSVHCLQIERPLRESSQ